MVSYGRAPVSGRARSPYQVDANVLRFYNDLNAHMSELTPMREIGLAPGFLDMTMATGDDWERDLIRAAGRCQVLVCLLSPRYLNKSEWCAMEWHIYSQRKIVLRGGGEPVQERVSNVVPVMWLPVVEEIPAVVNRAMRFSPLELPDPDYKPKYETYGLAGLLKMRLFEVYDAVVWHLAMHIQNRCAEYWVIPDVPASLDGVRRSFADAREEESA